MSENPWSLYGAEERVGADPELPDFLKLTPEEEADLLVAYEEKKTAANSLYASSRYSEAISGYDSALSSCPTYLDYEIAVLKSNIAACHIRLSEWKEAIEAANAALEGLDRLSPKHKKKTPKDKDKDKAEKKEEDDDVVIELEGSEDDEKGEKEQLEKLKLSDERKVQVASLRTKVLLRRAKASSEKGGWGDLVTAEQDYKELATMPHLSKADQRIVREQLTILPMRVNAAKDKEMGEMMGKLKEASIRPAPFRGARAKQHG